MNIKQKFYFVVKSHCSLEKCESMPSFSSKTNLPLRPYLLLPLSSVKISLLMPKCHMWSTLMRCIFNPTDLHFQNFPLPVLPRNGAQIENVQSGLSLVSGRLFWFFVCLYSGFFYLFSIRKIEAVALCYWYPRFTNSYFLDEFVKKKRKKTRPRLSGVNTLDVWQHVIESQRKWVYCCICEERCMDRFTDRQIVSKNLPQLLWIRASA